MAIQERPNRPKAWRVLWKNPYTGRTQSRSYSTKEEAQKADALIKFQLRFEKERFLPSEQEPDKEKDVDDSLEGIFYSYLKERQLVRTSFHAALVSMKLPLEMIGRKRISAITRHDLASVAIRMNNGRIKPTTIKTRFAYLKAVFGWAFGKGLIESIPVFPNLPKGLPEHFIPPTPEELAKLLNVASPTLQRVIIIGAKLGVRVGPSEMFKLRWEDFDLERGIVRVHAALKNKAEPWREIPIKKSLIPLFQTWKKEDDEKGWEFVVHTIAGGPETNINASWRRIVALAGITRRIRPYDLRHAFATEAIAAGADIGTVAKLMGHANANMILKHYQHVLTRQKEAAVEALPDIDTAALLVAQESLPKTTGIPIQ